MTKFGTLNMEHPVYFSLIIFLPDSMTQFPFNDDPNCYKFNASVFTTSFKDPIIKSLRRRVPKRNLEVPSFSYLPC